MGEERTPQGLRGRDLAGLGGILVAAGWGFGALAGLRATRGGSRRRSLQFGSRAAISVK